MTNANEMVQVLLDRVACGRLSRRHFLTVTSAAGFTAGLSGATVDQALAAGETQAANKTTLEGAYDYIVVGGGRRHRTVAENRFDVALPPPLRLTFDATQGRKSDHARDHT